MPVSILCQKKDQLSREASLLILFSNSVENVSKKKMNIKTEKLCNFS